MALKARQVILGPRLLGFMANGGYAIDWLARVANIIYLLSCLRFQIRQQLIHSVCWN